MKTYGTILIGCGHIGLEHIAEIHYRENVNLVACVDINPDAARMAAHRYGAQTFGTDYRPFLERDDVDIVIIATYTDSHLRILKDCFAKGKHVICEKPIAGSLEDGAEFVRTVKGSKQKCLVAHILRHNDSYIKIKKLIDDGAIGELKLIRMTQNHHAMNWERYKRLLGDCSPIIDCGVHYTDVVQWFSGQKITKALEDVRDLVLGTAIGDYKNTLNRVREWLSANIKDDVRRLQTFDLCTGIHVVTALEAPLLDLLGKYLDVPAALLGDGIQRGRVRFLCYLFYVGDRTKTDLPYARDDAKGMQYLIPGWKFDPKRPCMVR